MKKIFTLLLLLCSLQLFSQTIYFVKPTGNDANSGTSWATAFQTLQKAINTINTGQIWVAAGTYYPDEGPYQGNNNRNSYFTLKNNVALYGGFAGYEVYLSERRLPKNQTILSGELQEDNYMDNNALHVLRSANVNASAVLDGFTITRGRANLPNPVQDQSGGGLHNYYSSPTISNCLFVANSASYYGGGIANDHSSPILTNCRFLSNSAYLYNYITGIWDGWGAAIGNEYGSPTLINCSFSQNAAAADNGYAIHNVFSSLNLVNCILWDNGKEIYNLGDSASVSYSLVKGGYPGPGNISNDPLFVDAGAGNLHLQGCSPAIDAGRIVAVPPAVNTDADGNPRFVPGEVDMGAYEYQPGGAATIIFVNRMVSGGLHDGTSWVNAFDNLPDALQQAATCKGSEIWVTAGTYYPTTISTERTASFMMKNNTTLRGGFEGTEIPGDLSIRRYFFTTLSGDIDGDSTPAGNTYHVLQNFFLDSSAVIDGFIITGGNADGDANLKNDRGGGMLNEHSFPTVKNCIFTGNRALNYGGGMYNSNTDYPPILINCLFTRNTSGYAGGAIYNIASSPRIINCTFATNFAADKGGGVYNISSSSYPTITNCILWGNSSSIDTVLGGKTSVSYSIVQGGYVGTNNLTTDPLYINEEAGNLRLSLGSPAINAGNDTVVPANILTDLDSHPRKQGLHVDMGAYEFASAGGGPDPLNLTCPEDFTLQSNANGCGATGDFTGDHAATTSGGQAPIIITYSPASGTVLPVGVNTITVTANDGAGDTKTCSFTITVVDTTAPVISNIAVDKPVLYPPNHKMQVVKLNYNVSDNCADVTTTLSVTSNEPEYGSGSGDTGPDWQVVNNNTIHLRAERSGRGSDRIYTITITAKDASGNTSTATSTVTVPHNNVAPVTTIQRRIETEEVINGLKAQVFPNPATDGFTIKTQSASTLPISIQVINELGRMVEKRTGLAANGNVYLGSSYRPGMYIVKIVQGDTVRMIKVVKQMR